MINWSTDIDIAPLDTPTPTTQSSSDAAWCFVLDTVSGDIPPTCGVTERGLSPFFLIFLYFVGIIEHYMQILYTHTNVFLAKQAPATPCRVLFRWMALFLQEQEMRDPALLPSTITAHTNPGPEI